jgi:2-oxo-hept-3-ene-1,7-dioate hydratase
MLTDEEIVEAAAALYHAELDDEPVASISATYLDADVDDAYRISIAVTDLKVKAGRIIKGHKIGLTSKAMRSTLGATEPDYGTMFDNWFLLEGSTYVVGEKRRAVEVETAFVLREPLVGPGITAADVIRATDFVLPCVEIVGTRQKGTGPNPLVDSIADAAACAGVVLGGRPARLTDIDIRRIGGSLMINGVVEETGVGTAVMGNPINAVAWLANKLHKYGVIIEAGHVVLPGSFLKAIPLHPGDTIIALFDVLGEVTVRVE